jgi:hypothetical protein
MDAYRANAPRRLEENEIYGEVEYFVKHEHEGSDRMFAYVRKIDKYEEDNYGQIYFNKFSGFQFIEVVGIDRCVGFFKIENLFYILDRERI